MSNIEHLIENGLIAVEEARENGEDVMAAFMNEMNTYHNKYALSQASLSVSELWEIVQYVVFTYCGCCGKRKDGG